MKRKRFTEKQIISMLREQEAGTKVSGLARKHGISEAKLKKQLADQRLEATTLKELLSKGVTCPPGQGSISFWRWQSA